MTATAKAIKAFTAKGEEILAYTRTLEVGGEIRMKDIMDEEGYAFRHLAAARWLEDRAGWETILALYPEIDIVVK
jgi:hypothetical protein